MTRYELCRERVRGGSYRLITEDLADIFSSVPHAGQALGFNFSLLLGIGKSKLLCLNVCTWICLHAVHKLSMPLGPSKLPCLLAPLPEKGCWLAGFGCSL